MELLSPAGNLEKLQFSYQYGADAAYIGLERFSLRAKADNFSQEDYKRVATLKGNKKLYCALNIYFKDQDLRELEEQLDILTLYPFDAFIISDLGVLPFLRKYFPSTPLHLSTQANCINAEAAKIYVDLGFSRIILGREMDLDSILWVKEKLPNLEVEVFVHGAMCLAYSGRCFLSAYTTGRSGNRGDCAHTCRWEYRVLEEKERPGEYFPVEVGENYTTLLSSKDLCMIDYIPQLLQAGIDSAKIEGRMKSIYYTAVVTRAYRKAIDAAKGIDVGNLSEFIADLQRVSHREYTTGFFFKDPAVHIPTEKSYLKSHTLLGTVEEESIPGMWKISVKNSLHRGERVEFLGPELPVYIEECLDLSNKDGKPVDVAHHGKGEYYIQTNAPIHPFCIIRRINA